MYQNKMPSLFQVTEIKLTYDNKVKPKERHKILSPQHAYDVLMMAWDMNKIQLVEQAKLLLLDRSFGCIGLFDLSTGGVSSCLVDPKVVYAAALKARASAIILAHNHPSGSMQSSEADDIMTQRLSDAGHILDIQLMDHLIVSPHDYYSYVRNKAGPYEISSYEI